MQDSICFRGQSILCPLAGVSWALDDLPSGFPPGLILDPTLPFEVVVGLTNMTLSVQFNRQLCVIAKEIEHVTANWMLSTELKSREPSATQLSPQELFRDGRITTQSSSAIDRLCWLALRRFAHQQVLFLLAPRHNTY